MKDEQGVPFERQRGEPAKAYAAFVRYRDMGGDRSLDKAYRSSAPHRAHKKRSKTWATWSARWGWVQRAEAWDADVERQVRAKNVKELVDTRSRHLRIVQSQLQAAVVSARVVLEAFQDPAQLAALIADAKSSPRRLLDHLDRVSRHATATTALIETERLILGLSTEIMELEDKRAHAMGHKIPANPEAVAAAIHLLDLMAGTGVGTAPEEKNT